MLATALTETDATFSDGALTPEERRRTTTRIAMRVPKRCQKEPIISRLASVHGLTVNILAALLSDSDEDGWFTLELAGTTSQIQSGIIYLEDLDLEIWDKTTTEEESW
jgi:hypothetical protein